jgi:hypothetical protein
MPFKAEINQNLLSRLDPYSLEMNNESITLIRKHYETRHGLLGFKNAPQRR